VRPTDGGVGEGGGLGRGGVQHDHQQGEVERRCVHGTELASHKPPSHHLGQREVLLPGRVRGVNIHSIMSAPTIRMVVVVGAANLRAKFPACFSNH
jgi:hypothetical protein